MRSRCASSPTATRSCTSRLLTDFHDAAQETLPADARCSRSPRTGIAALNAQVPRTRGIRPLLPVPPAAHAGTRASGCWMGYERKRGKLGRPERAAARRPGSERFPRVVGDIARAARRALRHHARHRHPAAARRGPAARRDDGAPAEPAALRRAQRGAWSAGYGILQPRVGLSLPGANRSRYARLYGGEPGIDPYTRAVSDVYQDLFGEGSFIGKGIYDVDAFERALAGRLPENRILSHDLLEGCYARSGLLSDVQLSRNTPRRYGATSRAATAGSAATGRSAGWLLPRVPGCRGTRAAQSAVGAVAREDPRQPAPQPGADRAASCCCWPAGASLPARRAVDAGASSAIVADPGAAACDSWHCCASRASCACGRAACARSPAPPGAGLAQAGAAALACLPHEACYSLDAIAAHAVAHARLAAAPARMEPSATGPARRPAARRPATRAHVGRRRCSRRVAAAVGLAAADPPRSSPRRRCLRCGCRAAAGLVDRAGRCSAAPA